MDLAHHIHPGTGPHLLLVHGFLTGPQQWQPNLEALGAVCTPVTVSLWGHAGAPSPEDPDAYHPQAYVDGFERLRERLGASQWYLLGYSLGAGLTLRYVLEHPERVLAHAFTNSTSALADTGQQQAWHDGAEASARRIEEGGQAAMERIPVHPRHARKLPAPIREALNEAAAGHDPAGIANAMRHTNPNASVRDRLHLNRRPALLLCGVRERRFEPHRKFAESAMPQLEVADLEAGHGMNMEAPAPFNRALGAFLGAHATGPRRHSLTPAACLTSSTSSSRNGPSAFAGFPACGRCCARCCIRCSTIPRRCAWPMPSRRCPDWTRCVTSVANWL